MDITSELVRHHAKATHGLWYLSSGMVLTVTFLLGLMIVHILWRWYVDRKMGIKAGPTPSLWSPLGVEWIGIRQITDRQRIGDTVLNLMVAVARMAEKPRIFRAWIFHERVVALFKPETIEVILSSNTVLEKAMFYDLLRPWLGTGLLTSHGDKWRSRRKMLTPAFHFKILEDFIPIFNEQAAILANLLNAHSQMKPIDIVPLVTLCTLDVICETAMGVHINAQENSDSDYVRTIYELTELGLYRGTKPWLWPAFIFNLTPQGRQFNAGLKVLHGFTRKVIKNRKEEMLSRLQQGNSLTQETDKQQDIGVKRRQAFLDLLLERHIAFGDLTIEDIREEVDTFMFEGHDTTAMGISWCMYLLGLYPEKQIKVHEELNKVFADDPNRDVTIEDLSQLKYLECCIKETQRLFPSVPYIGRVLREDVEVAGYMIPKDTMAFLFIYQLHRDETSFPDPENFIPERFLPENSVGRHPYAYVPFSAGPRNCIGQRFAIMEEKVILTHILRKYQLRAQLPLDKIHVSGELVTRSTNGLPLLIKQRN